MALFSQYPWQVWLVLASGLVLIALLVIEVLICRARARHALARAVDEERARRQLEREHDERDRMNRQLVQVDRMEALSRFAGRVGRQLRSITADVPAEGEMAAAVLGQLRELSNELVFFSARKMERSELVDLAELLRTMEPTLVDRLGREVSLEIRVPSEGLFVRGDRSQLEYALTLVLLASRRRLSGAGTIRLEADAYQVDQIDARMLKVEPGECVVVTVRDSGPPLARENLTLLFEPSFEHTSTEERPGLGLATAYAIARGHRGTASAEIDPDDGTLIRLYLPRASRSAREAEVPPTEPSPTEPSPPADEASLPADESQPPPPALRHRVAGAALGPGSDLGAVPGSQPTGTPGQAESTRIPFGRPSSPTRSAVLVVDDDETVRAFVVDVLEGRGYRMSEAANGAEAVKLANQEQPALIILELVLPDGDAISLSDRLRAAAPNAQLLFTYEPTRQNLPLITRLNGELAGQKRVTIEKPFGTLELLRAAERALSHSDF